MTSARRFSALPEPPGGSSLWLGSTGLLLWCVSVVQADFSRMGSFGLVTVLGWPYFAGLALLVAGFAMELLHVPLRSGRVLVLVVGVIVVLFGTASAVEPTARLTDSWVHAGFVQYVFEHGRVLENYDARFSWPGGFSLGAVLVGSTGLPSAVDLLRWAPPVFELLYLPPLLVIARFSGVGVRAGWLGVLLFYATNWIDQDYFSPQALNYLFYLVVLATVLACWQPSRIGVAARFGGAVRDRLAATRGALTRRRLAGHDAVSAWNNGRVLAALGLLSLLMLATAISHQLTPYALILALAACLMTRRLGRPELLLIAMLLAVGWLSLGASNYWIGHLSDIFGSVGHVSNTFGSNVTHRVTGSSSHRWVVDLRILSTTGLFVLAGIGALRRSPDSRSLELLAAAPFTLLGFQSYGGEGLLRVVLFGLPFTTLLAASAVLPNRVGPIRSVLPEVRLGRQGRTVLRASVIVMVLGFCLLTTVVRGGNDAFEAYSTGELSAVNFAYDHVRPGEIIGAVAPYLPIGQDDVGTIPVYVAADQAGPVTRQTLQSDLQRTRPSLIILSQSQEAWGEIVEDYPKGWERTLAGQLQRDGYRVAATWPNATVLRATSTP